jgi:EAL domain-containing protein (putative c-di-GMP-specific phosphodiesterase class I)
VLIDAIGHILPGEDGGAAGLSPRLIRAAREHLGLEVGFISEFTADQRVFRHVDGSAGDLVLAPGDADPLEESYCQRVVDGRLPELIADAAALPEARTIAATEELPVGAHVSVPLVLPSGRLYGTFCCFSRTPDHSLNQRDLDVMRFLADICGQDLERELAETKERDEIVARIRSALNEPGRLRMVFQPVIDLASGRTVGFEALARFGGPLERTPDVWFAEACSVGLGNELEGRAIRLALDAFDTIPDGVLLGVNASPEAVVSGVVTRALHAAPLDRVVLEMTEHAPVTDYPALRAALAPLRDRGMKIAVDDAGAGYSTLRHILLLEPEIIKLDATLTSGLDTDPAKQALAAALVQFSAQVGSAIIGEGIETEGELEALSLLGVKAGQGFHLGRPGSLPAVEADSAYQRSRTPD